VVDDGILIEFLVVQNILQVQFLVAIQQYGYTIRHIANVILINEDRQFAVDGGGEGDP
jgi:hypothetical protein